MTPTVCDSTKLEELYTVRKQLPTIDRLFAVPLRERIRTHKVFTKTHTVFYLDYHKFSIKSYVLDVYYNRLSEAILIHIHNICFYGEISKFFTFYHFDSDPRYTPFLLYVRWKSGVTFVRRCVRDVRADIDFKSSSETVIRWSSR